MGRVILFVALYLVILIFLIAGKANTIPTEGCKKSQFSLGNTHISLVGVAATPDIREKGLSGHAPLAVNEGMLFLFDDVRTKQFWMKDMLFPIDIIWISPEWRVNGWTTHVLPESYPNFFFSPRNTQFVLEVPEGTVERLKLSTGTVAKILPCDELEQ